MDAAYDWAAENSYSASTGATDHMTVYRDLSGSLAGADIIVNDFYYENQFIGWASCDTAATIGSYGGENWCDPMTVRYNSKFKTTAYNTTAKRRAEACHETGHAIGLQHPGTLPHKDSCMKTGIITYAHISRSCVQGEVQYCERHQLNKFYNSAHP